MFPPSVRLEMRRPCRKRRVLLTYSQAQPCNRHVIDFREKHQVSIFEPSITTSSLIIIEQLHNGAGNEYFSVPSPNTTRTVFPLCLRPPPHTSDTLSSRISRETVLYQPTAPCARRSEQIQGEGPSSNTDSLPSSAC
jgi:hypothetical protein